MMETKGKKENLENVKDNLEEPTTKEEAVDEIKEVLSEENKDDIVKEEKLKPRSSKKKDEDEDIVEERVYTIPLGRALVRPPKKRAPRAISLIREFIKKHMKMDLSALAEEERGELPKLSISNAVNEKIWSRSIKKPPRRIRVRVTKDKEDNVKVFLAKGE